MPMYEHAPNRAMQVNAFKVDHLSYQRPACMHRRRTSDMQESMISRMLRRFLCSHGSKGSGSPHQTDRHTTRARVAELSQKALQLIQPDRPLGMQHLLPHAGCLNQPCEQIDFMHYNVQLRPSIRTSVPRGGQQRLSTDQWTWEARPCSSSNELWQCCRAGVHGVLSRPESLRHQQGPACWRCSRLRCPKPACPATPAPTELVSALPQAHFFFFLEL